MGGISLSFIERICIGLQRISLKPRRAWRGLLAVGLGKQALALIISPDALLLKGHWCYRSQLKDLLQSSSASHQLARNYSEMSGESSDEGGGDMIKKRFCFWIF